MGKITGNDKDFPTIKQVNDKDITIIGDNEYNELDNQHIIEMLEKIIQVKPTILKGISENNNIDFETSNIKWGITSMPDNGNDYVNQWIISFKIYIIIYGLSYHFIFFKMLEDYLYSKYIVDANGF